MRALMNIIRYYMKAIKYIGMLAMSLLAFTFTSCEDDDDAGSTAMSVNAIYLEDASSSATVNDRLVDFARLGQLIRIEGSGFIGLKKIYINGYETYFNNALMTDNNVWVTLNSKTPIVDADPAMRNKIRMYKSESNYIDYDFTIRASSPSVSSVDNTLPMPGERVTVKGANLQETTKVTLPGGIEITSGIECDVDGEWYSFVMPEGVTEAGMIVSEGANGIAQTAPYFNDNRCYIINFDGLGTQGSWSATFSAEELVDDPLNSGRGKVCQIIPELYFSETGPVAGGVSNIKGFWTAGNDDPDDDWSRMYASLPDGKKTLLKNISLQFDVYVPAEWNLSGQVCITLQNNLSNYGYGSACTKPSTDYINQAYAWVPWLDRETGEATPFTTGERWQTVTIPITHFGNYNNDDGTMDFEKVVSDRNAGSYRNFGFLFCNADVEYSESVIYEATAFDGKIYIDNFRIVYSTSETVSDYPDEE